MACMRRTSWPVIATTARRLPWSRCKTILCGRLTRAAEYIYVPDFSGPIHRSTTFDILDHDILLRHLEESVGLSGLALRWMDLYLHSRSVHDYWWQLRYQMQQTSVLGPILFTSYTIPISHVARKCNLEMHQWPIQWWHPPICVLQDQVAHYTVGSSEHTAGLCWQAQSVDGSQQALPQWCQDGVPDPACACPGTTAVWRSAVCGWDSHRWTLHVPTMCNLGVIMDSMLNMEAHVQRLCQTSVAQS